ncbi:MAG: pyridoxal-phosphate dependent enzyme [Acidobacteria bacterium]|nr:pyridoxal-phosphate dependent enzyme [Acidobacteriota bacterium]
MRMDSSSSAVSASERLSLEKVAAAWRTVRPVLWPTPLLRSPALDELSGFQVWLKPENLQRTGSYKIRGAYYKLHQLQERGGIHKVVAASAGNHAQGVAYAARELGMDCVIVMPDRAALPKLRATQHYGTKVLLEGSCFDDSLAFALRYAAAEGREFISPFNDSDVILGQATLGWEILEEMQDHPPEAVLVPVGGGGLIAGVASAVKQRLPKTKIIALQSTCAPAFVNSWHTYRSGSAESLPLDVATQETIADGVRVRQPGELCWRMCRDLVDAAICVDDVRIYRAILFLVEQAKLVAEGAGALSVAALLDPESRRQIQESGVAPGARVVALVTGGNIDSLTLQRVVERGLAMDGRSQSISVRVSDEPGQLGFILDFLRRHRATVLDFRRSWRIGPRLSDMADIEILIETEDEQHGREILEGLAREAKVHNFELLLENPNPEGPRS